MSDAPETIWAFHAGPMVGYFVGKDPGHGANVAEYRRADLPAPDPMDDPRVRALVDVLHGEEDRGYCLSPAACAALAAMEPDNE